MTFDGVATNEGRYPELPASDVPRSAVIDAEGHLIALVSEGRVVRLSVAGESETLHEPGGNFAGGDT